MIKFGNTKVNEIKLGNTNINRVYQGNNLVFLYLPESIRDNLVLWYDPALQGCTNENMTANPILKDLSGNGHNATCNNFSWNVDSGIGGYGINFNTGWTIEGLAVRNNSYSVTLKQALNDDSDVFTNVVSSLPSLFTANVSGLEQNIRLEFGSGTIAASDKSIYEDGVHTFYTNYDVSAIGFKLYTLDGSTIQNLNVTIEIIPLYPNALVFDGTDDYCFVEGLPILTDYTVIARRKLLDKENGVFASKRNINYKNWTEVNYGAFIIEKELNVFSFHNLTAVDGRTSISDIFNPDESIIYLTKTSYCGKTINVGTSVDSDFLLVGAGYIGDNNVVGEYRPCVLWSFILFDRTLTDAEITWVKENMVEVNPSIYGITFDTASSSPECTRIGNIELHKTLPILSAMKGCLLNDDGEVVKYLNETDWTSETRDGSLGQVMVEVPTHYVKFSTEGTVNKVEMSLQPLIGFTKISKYYISAYEASILRSTNKLCSVVNTTTDYRGGNNNADWDGTYRSLLGLPATNISRTNFRTYARNRKADSTEWNIITYGILKDLYWLFVVEYATLNTQKAFNASKTADGFAQGGLGDGVTTLDPAEWGNYNGSCAVILCGYTDALGNGTGYIEFSMPTEYDATIKKVNVPRYHGIENAFGHLWQWTDGINVRINPNSGNGLSEVFVCYDPSKFSDNDYDGYTYIGNEARTEAYVKEIIFGDGGDIMPSVVGGSSSTYFCDYHCTNIPTSVNLRGVLFGGNANRGSLAGFVFAYSYYVPSDSYSAVGSRLCFIPNN